MSCAFGCSRQSDFSIRNLEMVLRLLWVQEVQKQKCQYRSNWRWMKGRGPREKILKGLCESVRWLPNNAVGAAVSIIHGNHLTFIAIFERTRPDIPSPFHRGWAHPLPPHYSHTAHKLAECYPASKASRLQSLPTITIIHSAFIPPIHSAIHTHTHPSVIRRDRQKHVFSVAAFEKSGLNPLSASPHP